MRGLLTGGGCSFDRRRAPRSLEVTAEVAKTVITAVSEVAAVKPEPPEPCEPCEPLAVTALAEAVPATGPPPPELHGDSRVLVKWRGLDYSECSWEVWRDARSFVGAREAWARCHRLCLRPPATALSERELARCAARTFHPMREYQGLAPGMELRPYQTVGINWLLACWHAGRPNVLADEMGLGKTARRDRDSHSLWRL